MKTNLFFLTVFAILITTSSVAQVSNFIDKTDFFLKKYVIDGKVNYNAINKNQSELNELITLISNTELDAIHFFKKKAYLINVYNLLVINQINMAYPIASPMDIIGFFDQNKFNIGGRVMTLNHLENNIIRKQYPDARLHFVLVCGANGCPVIGNFAYTSNLLEYQLKFQTKQAINNSNFIKIDTKSNEIALSEIFKWYATDFRLTSKNDIEFINKYRENSIPKNYKTTYYPYDWSLNEARTLPGNISTTNQKKFNLQTYTVGSLLRKKQLDFSVFNSVYTETKSNWLGTDYTGFRNTFSTSLFQFTYGISNSARVNIGLEISLKANAHSSNNSFSTIGLPFAFQNNDSMRAGISYIAPKIKLSPFKRYNNFTIQSSIISSFAKDPEGSSDSLSWLEWDRYIWWNQFFYSRSFANNKFQLFTEFDLLFRFAKRNNQRSHLDLPISAFISYFPNPKITFYAMTQHVPKFVYYTSNNTNTDWVINANYTQSGIGLKYQLLPTVNLELLYTNFWRSVNNGQGQTFNFGIKYVR